jgi:AcrR family transcriptional regulator
MVEGYASTGMELVARDAGVSTATLYSYFPSKADLFKHVIEETAQTFSALLTDVTSVKGDTIAHLREFAYAYGRFMYDPFTRSVFRLVTAERRRFEAVARQFYGRGRDVFGGALVGILVRLQTEGRVKCDKPSWAAGQLMGMIEHPTFMVPLISGEEVTVERNVEHICDDAVETFLARYGAKT